MFVAIWVDAVEYHCILQKKDAGYYPGVGGVFREELFGDGLTGKPVNVTTSYRSKFNVGPVHITPVRIMQWVMFAFHAVQIDGISQNVSVRRVIFLGNGQVRI